MDECTVVVCWVVVGRRRNIDASSHKFRHIREEKKRGGGKEEKAGITYSIAAASFPAVWEMAENSRFRV